MWTCRMASCSSRACWTPPPNFIEHPELIAQRIANYANVVGRENVMASSDCGFGTSAWGRKVEANIAWAKLASMVEGARLASTELW